MPEKVWGYIGTTKIILVNPEKMDEAFERGIRVLAELRMNDLKKGIKKKTAS